MGFYRMIAPCLRYCRTRSGTYMFTSLLVLVLLGLFILTLLSFTSRTDTLLYNEEIQQSIAFKKVPYLASSTPEPIMPKQKVLLMGYMRSGSTLCGDILQAHPKVFYFYEPLLYLWDHFIPGREPYEKDLRKRAKTEFVRLMHSAPEPDVYLDSMFKCNLTSYNLKFLTNVRHSRPFRTKECKYDKKRFYGIEDKRIEACGALLRQWCSESHTIIQKVVRMSMAEVDVLLTKDPHLKVIHLVRDPRGTFLSRMHFTAKSSGEMHKNISNLCQRLGNDLQVSQTLADKFWGRILTVRYEDLSQNTEAVSAMMYRFTGLEFLPSVKAYLKVITNTEVLDSKGNPQKKSTSRKDPFSTAYHWREELPWDSVQKADKVCGTVYRIMGYHAFSTEASLRNMSIPAKGEEFGEKLMTVW